MQRIDTVIIGGGQAGLAMSACLTRSGIEHVVLERGRIGERWRSERWDSLRLLTPRWQSRLPGFRYRGAEPDGYMSSAELVSYLEVYAERSTAPVQTGTSVRRVRSSAEGYCVETDLGSLQARSVVIATGHCDQAWVPPFAADLHERIARITPNRYRSPRDLSDGGVLVVGASATGVQLAEELQRSGRSVFLSVAKHTRIPRMYRGRDIMWWLDRMGIWDETIDQVGDETASREQPSLQLVGRPERDDLDLGKLQALGVTLLGRMIGADGDRAHFASDLTCHVRDADQKLSRLLDRVDAFAASARCASSVEGPWRPRPIRVGDAPRVLSLDRADIATVLFATGFRRSYPWLDVPVLDAREEIRQRYGVTPQPGLYTLGLRFQRRRKSSFLDGVGDDAVEIAAHLARFLRHRAAA